MKRLIALLCLLVSVAIADDFYIHRDETDWNALPVEARQTITNTLNGCTKTSNIFPENWCYSNTVSGLRASIQRFGGHGSLFQQKDRLTPAMVQQFNDLCVGYDVRFGWTNDFTGMIAAQHWVYREDPGYTPPPVNIKKPARPTPPTRFILGVRKAYVMQENPAAYTNAIKAISVWCGYDTNSWATAETKARARVKMNWQYIADTNTKYAVYCVSDRQAKRDFTEELFNQGKAELKGDTEFKTKRLVGIRPQQKFRQWGVQVTPEDD